ncbi:MAG: DUF1080 domain-containing protein [Gammaproteobacteria bacterium]|nr:DUF1080 domain-containing protein [Gammaproteobacteria bacterium]
MNPTALRAALLSLSLAATAGSAADQGGGAPWRPLLREHSAPDWRGWKEPGLPAGWHVDGGVLHKDGPVDDLVSNEKFANFELELEWKIGKEGNSGIFYRGTREYDHIYWSAPEYQLLDDANTEDGKSPLTAAGSDYALYGVPPHVAKPFDQWNRTRLIVKGHHVEHWLNGVKVVEYDLASADWKQRVAASKFAKYPNYGLADSGLIGIQGDHPGALAVRNLRIRVLP